MRKLVLSAVSALAALTIVAETPAAPDQRADPRPDAQLSALVVDQINAFRQAHGLGALHEDVDLGAAAQAHTLDMAAVPYFGHGAFASRIEAYYPHVRGAGENLFWASGDLDAVSVVDAWAASPEHRANLLDPSWRDLGVSAVSVSDAGGPFGDADAVIVTADFGVSDGDLRRPAVVDGGQHGFE